MTNIVFRYQGDPFERLLFFDFPMNHNGDQVTVSCMYDRRFGMNGLSFGVIDKPRMNKWMERFFGIRSLSDICWQDVRQRATDILKTHLEEMEFE